MTALLPSEIIEDMEAEFPLDPHESRSRSKSVQAMRRLSTTEIRGLGIALDHVDHLEQTLVTYLQKTKASAIREQQIRKAKGLPPEGPQTITYNMTIQTLRALSDARDQVTVARDQGKVSKARRSPHSNIDAAGR